MTKYCPVSSCPWESYRSTDPEHLNICLNQLLVHLRYEHSESEAEAQSDQEHRPKNNKASLEYNAATKPRTISKTIDDARTNLCEARFFPFPMDLRTLGLNMTCIIYPVNSVIDMSHVGVDINNPEDAPQHHKR